MNAMTRLAFQRRRLAATGRSTETDTGYPWVDGDILYADDLNAAVGDSFNVINVLNHGAKGNGSTDDTAAIQAALTTYAGKAAVLIPYTGQPYIVGPLSPPSGTDLIINGTLKLRPNATNALLNINNASNIVIRGYGVVDGNKVAQAAGLGGGPVPLAASTVTNLTVRDVTLQNAFYWNMNVTESSKVLIENVKMFNGTNANEFAFNCDECWMTNCTIDGVVNDIAFSFYGGVTNSGCIGNTIKNGFGQGIVVLADPGSPNPCHNIVISDNIIHDCGGGIATDRTPGSTAIHTGIVISGNRIYHCGLVDGSFVGISVGSADDVTVSGNHVSTIGVASALPQWGLYSGTTARNVSFIGNHVYNVGPVGFPGWGVGLYIDLTSGVMASGNYFYDNQASPTMAKAVSGTCGPKNILIGNFCDMPNDVNTVGDTVVANAVGAEYILGSRFAIDNTTAVNSGILLMGNNNHNSIQFNGAGLGLPTFTTRSVGTKILLEADLSPTRADYAIGMANSTLWFSVPDNTDGFAWYSGTTRVAALDRGGKLNLSALPTSASGLVAGDLWRNGTVLNIV
jgi:hypothetical protein